MEFIRALWRNEWRIHAKWYGHRAIVSPRRGGPGAADWGQSSEGITYRFTTQAGLGDDPAYARNGDAFEARGLRAHAGVAAARGHAHSGRQRWWRRGQLAL